MNNVRELRLLKRGHIYLFRYQTGDEEVLFQVLMAKAEDQTSELDWFDVAVLAHQTGHNAVKAFQVIVNNKLQQGKNVPTKNNQKGLFG